MGKKLLLLTIAFFVLFISNAQASNLAYLHGTATANGEYYPPTWGAGKAIDGDLTTNWSAPGWATVTNPYWLQIDLGNVYSVDNIVLMSRDSSSYSDGFHVAYNLYSSIDGSAWNFISSGTLFDSASEWSDSIDMDGSNLRYVKYEVVSGTHWAHLYEMEINDAGSSAVPEPATMMLLGFGLIGLAGISRKK